MRWSLLCIHCFFVSVLSSLENILTIASSCTVGKLLCCLIVMAIWEKHSRRVKQMAFFNLKGSEYIPLYQW